MYRALNAAASQRLASGLEELTTDNAKHWPRGHRAVKLQKVEINQSEQAIHESLTEREITPLIITKDGKAVAALVPLTNTDIETASLSLNYKFLAIIERSRSRLKAEGGVPGHLMEGRFGERTAG